LDYISDPRSGFIAYDRNSTDLLLQEPGGRGSMLYDERTARDLGRKMGVSYVCIIDLTREENEFLIECKLINVDTGLARSKSEIVSGTANADIKRASEAMIKRLLAKDGVPFADGAAAASDAAPAAADRAATDRIQAADRAATDRMQARAATDRIQAADRAATDRMQARAATDRIQAADSAAAKMAPAAPAPIKDYDDERGKSAYDFTWFGGVSLLVPTGDLGKTFDGLGFGISASAEMNYWRIRAEATYCPRKPHQLFSYSLGIDGMYRFGGFFGRRLYVFGGVAGMGGTYVYDGLTHVVVDVVDDDDDDNNDQAKDIPGFNTSGFGVGFSAGVGYNFNRKIGVEASYTTANKIISPLSFEQAQVSVRYRF
jgi:hypothetical protein